MKKLFMMAVFAVSVVTLAAQTEEKKDENPDAWKLTGITGLNFSQMAQSAWAAGGDNSYAGNAYLNATLSKKTGKWLWTNDLAVDYGVSYTKTQKQQKSSDKLEFSTKLGYTASKNWYYAGLVDYKTQFYKGYKYPNKSHYISKFMAPAYSNISLGMEYKPNDRYSVYMSPVTGKLTFVQDDYLSSLGAFGVAPNDKFRAEFGAYLKAKTQLRLMENVEAISTIDFFTAYDDSFGNVDINWDLLISMKVNKFLTTSLNMSLKYDDDVKYVGVSGMESGPKVQFKEMLGIGVAYNF